MLIMVQAGVLTMVMKLVLMHRHFKKSSPEAKERIGYGTYFLKWQASNELIAVRRFFIESMEDWRHISISITLFYESIW